MIIFKCLLFSLCFMDFRRLFQGQNKIKFFNVSTLKRLHGVFPYKDFSERNLLYSIEENLRNCLVTLFYISPILVFVINTTHFSIHCFFYVRVV